MSLPPIPHVFQASPERVKQSHWYLNWIEAVCWSLLALAITVIVLVNLNILPFTDRIYGVLGVFIGVILLMLVKLRVIKRKRDKWSSPTGEVVRVEHAGLVIAGEAYIPWESISYVFGLDLQPDLDRQLAQPFWRFTGPLMLKAGTNKSMIQIGLWDTRDIQQTDRKHFRFSKREGFAGNVPGHVDIPFGIYLESSDFYLLMEYIRFAIGHKVPVKQLHSGWDYGIATVLYEEPFNTIVERAKDYR